MNNKTKTWLDELEEQLNCKDCKWLGVRHQKCSCCTRNSSLKDNYEPKYYKVDGGVDKK